MILLLQLLLLIPFSPMLAQVQVGNDLLGSEAGEQMGMSVTLSGDGSLVAMGGPFKGSSQGSVLVFADAIDDWSFQWSIEGIIGGSSGFSIDISDDGKTLAITSPTTLEGQFNVFTRSGADYVPLGMPVGGPGDPETLFGFKVTLSGDGKRLAAGAISFDGSEPDVGFVQAFELIEGEWQPLGTPLSGTTPFGQLGRGLDLSFDGSIMAVGIPTALDNPGTGEVRVYTIDGDDWEMLGEPIFGGQDLTGYSVALSADGTHLAVGAPLGDGKVSIYEYQGAQWMQLGQNLSIESSASSGADVDISGDGNRVIVGALGSDNPPRPGTVAVYDYDGKDWQPVFDEVKGAVGESFGWSVDLSAEGQTFAVGIPGSDVGDSNQGRVEVYAIDPIQTNVRNLTNEDIQVFPNPTTGPVEITGKDVNYHRVVRVVDITGRHIQESFIRQGMISIGALPSGLYFLHIPTGQSDFVSIKFAK